MTKHNISILYVEDEENVRVMLSRFLQRFCSELYVAENGEEGVELYKEYQPDIVISDIKMPKMNGLEMVQKIKDIDNSQLVLLLTAHSDSEYLFEAINLNVDGYILKPIDLDIVHDKITQLIEIIENQKAVEALKESEEKFRTLTQISLTGIFIYHEKFIYVNPAFCEITGYTQEELLSMYPWEVLTSQYQGKIKEVAKKRISGEMRESTQMQVDIKTKDGRIRNTKVSVATMPYQGGFVGTGNIIDITDVIEAKSRLQLLSQAIDQMDEMVRITDIDGNIIYVNPATSKTTQYAEDEILGNSSKMFQSGKHSKEFYNKLWNTILSGHTYQNILINKKKDGSFFYDEKIISPLKNENGDIRYFVSTSRDISKRVALEKELKRLATKDALTGIYNRYKINTKIEEEIKRADRYGEPFALVMFDIDHFKQVNDTYGHDAGDYVLQELSKIILNNIRETDSFGRWGGEEFMLLLPYTSKEKAVKIAEKMRQRVQEHTFENVRAITISIGVTVYKKGEGISQVLKRVDMALYEAKSHGRNQVVSRFE